MPQKSKSVLESELGEMPRERLERYGAGVLSAAELVAIILNTGIPGESVFALSQRILEEHDGLTGLMRLDHADLANIKGIGPAKAAKLKAALEMGRRLDAIGEGDRPKVGSPEDIVRLLGVEMASLDREQLRVVMLNSKHHITGTHTVAHGTVNSAAIRMSEVFAPVVRRNAPYIALVHNHPTGDPTPSAADVQFTRDAVRAARLLDIEVVDHVIIGQGRHSSLRRLGLGFDTKEQS